MRTEWRCEGELFSRRTPAWSAGADDSRALFSDSKRAQRVDGGGVVAGAVLDEGTGVVAAGVERALVGTLEEDVRRVGDRAIIHDDPGVIAGAVFHRGGVKLREDAAAHGGIDAARAV